MPRYSVSDDSGTTLTIEGDSPPSESELNEIFSAAAVEAGPKKITIIGSQTPHIPGIQERLEANPFSAGAIEGLNYLGGGVSKLSEPLVKVVPKLTERTVGRVLAIPAAIARERMEMSPDEAQPSKLTETVAGLVPSDKTIAIVTGAQNATADLTNFFTSPLGIATLGSGALPALGQRAVALTFSAQMASQLPGIAGELQAELALPEEKRNYKRISELATSGIASLGFSAVGAYKGLKPVEPKFVHGEIKGSDITTKADEIAPVAPLTAEALKQTVAEKPVEAKAEPTPAVKPPMASRVVGMSDAELAKRASVIKDFVEEKKTQGAPLTPEAADNLVAIYREARKRDLTPINPDFERLINPPQELSPVPEPATITKPTVAPTTEIATKSAEATGAGESVSFVRKHGFEVDKDNSIIAYHGTDRPFEGELRADEFTGAFFTSDRNDALKYGQEAVERNTQGTPDYSNVHVYEVRIRPKSVAEIRYNKEGIGERPKGEHDAFVTSQRAGDLEVIDPKIVQVVKVEKPFSTPEATGAGEVVQRTPEVIALENERVKMAEAKQHVAQGLKPENMQVTVDRGTVPYVQVDEITGKGNTFSSNPERLNAAGFKMPTSEELLKLEQGQYSLPEAIRKLAELENPTPTAQTLNEMIENAPEKKVVEPTVQKATEKIAEQVQETAVKSGMRPARDVKVELLSRIDEAMKGAPEQSVYSEGKHGFVEINIPGDGNFRVRRNLQALGEIRSRVNRMSVSAGTPSRISGGAYHPSLSKEGNLAVEAYGGVENAYRSVKRQRDALPENDPDTAQQFHRAENLLYELYQKTDAYELEVKSSQASMSAQRARMDIGRYQAEIDRIQALKRPTAAHKQKLQQYQDLLVKSKENNEIFTRSATSFKRQSEEAKARLEGTPEPAPIGPGMGAALAKGEPAKAQLAQLADSLKTMAEQVKGKGSVKAAFDLGKSASNIKDGVSEGLEGLKAVGAYAKMRFLGKPVVTDIKRAKGDRHLALSESAWNARKFVADANKAVPDPLLQEAISDYIDTGGDIALLKQGAATTKDRYRAGYELAQKLTPEQKVIAENARNYFESRLQEAINAGVLEDGIENYIHRIYESESPWKQGIIAELRSGIFTGRPGLARQRVFQYDFEAEQKGLKPVKSFIKRIAAYDLALNKAIADRGIVKAMMAIKMADGRPMLDIAGVGSKVEGPTGETDATFINRSWKPGTTTELVDNRGDFKPYDHPSLRKWKWMAADENGKPIFVQGDVLVHPDAIKDIKSLFEQSLVRKNPVGRAALGIGATIKQTMLDLSGFHFTQITVHGWEHRTFKPVSEIDFQNPNVRGLIRGGMVVGETHGYELFSEGLVGSSLTKYIPYLGPRLHALNDALFNSYIPRLKTAMALHALERNRTRFPELTPEELYHLTANQANAAFGELNYEMMGRSKTTQDIFRLIALAPDFLEARGRFAAQAMTKYGREQTVALALGAGVLYLTARIINKLLTDEYHFETKNAFNVVYNGKAYSLRTVQGDILHLATDPRRFAFNRLNPVWGRTGIEALTQRDVFGRKRDFTQQLQDFGTTIVPISLRGLVNPREQNMMESALNAFGITERRSTPISTIYDLAQDWKKKNNVRGEPGEFIYDPDKDPFRPIRNAATFSPIETIVQEISKAVEAGNVSGKQIKDHFDRYGKGLFTGSKSNESKFVKSLSTDQKKIYDDAKEEKKKVRQRFNEAYHLYLTRTAKTPQAVPESAPALSPAPAE